MRFLLLALALSSAPALAQSQQSDEDLKKELEKALQQDASSSTQKGQPVPAGANPAPAAAAPAPAPSTSASAAPQSARGSQSLNPDISAILDANAGYERRAVSYRNGDDPDLHSDPTHPGAGFTAQEVEVALSAIVDPYFKGEVYLTIPNLSGLEVEEAFATTTSLPGNLQFKMGEFRSAFGRQNGQHLHVQDFTRRPLINDAFLGADGLRAPGGQVSWLTPAPFYLVLYFEAFSGPPNENAPGDPVQSFGGGKATDLTYTAEAKYFFPFGDSVSVYGGFSAATGVSPGYMIDAATTAGVNRRSELIAADLYVKWKPPNVAGGYTALMWQTEAIFRHLESGNLIDSEWDGGMYTQLVLQFARSWFAGARFDYVGLPQSSVVGRTIRGAIDLTWQASEFARVRGYLEAENASGGGLYQPAVTLAANPSTSLAAYLQLEFSIGAHGAHPF